MEFKDTTVKLDRYMVEEAAAELPPGYTLSSFVREAVEQHIRRGRMQRAAEAYREALAADAKLADEMDEWESAPLLKEPLKKQ